ncbi:hypothetical protein J1N35_010630 [Gossypium stocksii]|uniref:MSP domain-containing protein n=1 Tax=Gossypium stocksii TaxID=47602 RepID=A0A9D3W1Q6_9ROSI|nr:hypothetical protein J1N35_010630 [Gossypium stocksii]
MMSTGELLSIDPQELQFPFELRKQISCSLNLSNKTYNYVAFKLKTTNPKKYCVRPNTGVVLPASTSNVIAVTMQAQKEAPPDMQCKDKFLLQSVVASPGTAAKDITPEMFNKESGNYVEECKLRVVYPAPPQPPSHVQEGSEEGSSSTASVLDNGSLNASEFTSARSRISKLAEEKNVAIQQNKSLQQELELLRRKARKGHNGIPLMNVTTDIKVDISCNLMVLVHILLVGVLSMITTFVEKVHEAYEGMLTALSQGGLKSKTLEILGCLAIITFFGASN